MSNEPNTANNTPVTVLSMYLHYRQAQPSQVYFTGEVKGESAMKMESDIGSPIRYQFRVRIARTSLSTHIFSNIIFS